MNKLKLPELSTIVLYRSSEVILKFARDNNISVVESEILFKETMKMLWLMVKHQLCTEDKLSSNKPKSFNVQKSMEPLDKMWHEFILFTREYHQFCDEFFGCYLHHVPCSDKEYKAFKQRASEQKDDFVSQERQTIGLFAKYIQDNLGRDTLQTWFMGLPKIE